jgi:Major Facilitator Superfamily
VIFHSVVVFLMASSSETNTARPATLGSNSRRQIYAYIAVLMTLTAFCDPNSGLMDIPFSFILKNNLRLDAPLVSQFRFVVSIPLFLSFIFGLVRDNWSPFRLGDRGHLLLFSTLSAATYLLFAAIGHSAPALSFALLSLTMWSLFIASAQNGLTATLGDQHAMTGQMSAIWNLFTALPAIIAFLIGGTITDFLEGLDAQAATGDLFLIGAGASFVLLVFSTIRARAVYDQVRRDHDTGRHFWVDLKTLAGHRPARRALLIWSLWNFAPGSATPLQFYLQDVLGGTPGDWGRWNAVFTASFVPAFLIYGWLSSRWSEGFLLRAGTLIAIPQFMPLLFVGTLATATLAAVPIGMMGGLASVAYLALIMRAAPRGLEGTMMMSASSVYFVATRAGDLLGSTLYDINGNFTLCIVLSSAIYFSIWFFLPSPN